MQINIEANSAELTEQVEQLLQFYQSSLRDAVEVMSIQVGHTQDALGTSLYRCRLHAKLSRGADIVIDETQVDLYRAVTRSFDRCARGVRRRFDADKLSNNTYVRSMETGF